MDPRESSSDPENPELPKPDYLPDSSVNGNSLAERVDAASNTSRPYGRHAAREDEQRPDFLTPEHTGPATTWLTRSQDPTSPRYTYRSPPPLIQTPPPLHGQTLQPEQFESAEYIEQSEQSHQRGIGAVWLSVLFLLAAGAALLVAFLWIMGGSDANRGEREEQEDGAVTRSTPANTITQSSGPPSVSEVPPDPATDAEPSRNDPRAVPQAPVIPGPPPNPIQDWSNQLNNDINGIINDFQNQFSG